MRERERERKERDALGAPSAASFSPPPWPPRLLIGRPRGRRCWLGGDGVDGVGEEHHGRGLEVGGAAAAGWAEMEWRGWGGASREGIGGWRLGFPCWDPPFVSR
jgi:hypothetical protein